MISKVLVHNRLRLKRQIYNYQQINHKKNCNNRNNYNCTLQQVEIDQIRLKTYNRNQMIILSNIFKTLKSHNIFQTRIRYKTLKFAMMNFHHNLSIYAREYIKQKQINLFFQRIIAQLNLSVIQSNSIEQSTTKSSPKNNDSIQIMNYMTTSTPLTPVQLEDVPKKNITNSSSQDQIGFKNSRYSLKS
ncbi:unnamed protein product [Paramecium primaurelia]|uniref:Uncharacterized protein n=1 Tax=Paramecium primaurelia TaxID=5886 RepID=A0A8S1KBS8_PARPR|nr:unnamed protein product [Paramecium primaurelia]